MAENVGRTLVGSVLFLDIVGYSKQSVAEQQRVKQSFNDTLARALESVAQRDRIILDTGDGAAVTFFGDPEKVLQVALAIRDSIQVPTRMGINLGPVRTITDLNGHVNVIGDGINVGQRVMSFADPGQLLVSRSFYEFVSTLADEYADLFTHVGARQDKHVRAHDVYSVGKTAPRKPAAAPAASADLAGLPAEIFDAGEHLIVSAYSRARVQEELDRLAHLGARVLSEITTVGNKWVASCARPDVPTLSRVAQLGNMRIVTGPTREVVTAKQKKLIEQGAAPVSDVECINGVWTAVCELRGND
jgi:class 3 adenylate cyclase